MKFTTLIKSFFLNLLAFVLFASTMLAEAQNLKTMDRKKWKELVEEVKNRRFDPKEKENPYKENQEDNFYNGDREDDGEEENEYNSTYNDQNIYSAEDGDFFDENNDGNGPGGNDDWGYPNGDLDPKYMDEDEGFGNPENNGGGTKPYSSSDPQPREFKPLPKEKSSSTTTSSGSSGGGDASWLLWVLIGLLAAALIYMILVSFKENKKTKPVESVESKFENLTISKSELELALEAALRDKNYREAVRIYFIAVIKEMKDRSWIKWEKKKTNHHYINEISGRTQQPDFITATRAFEIVWYGNRDLAVNEYNQIEPVFKKLIQSIK